MQEVIYNYQDVEKALETIRLAFESGIISAEQYHDAVEKASKYGHGKRKEFVSVTREGKTFIRYQEVGSDKIKEEGDVTLYVDLDGVIVDFDKGLYNLIEKFFKDDKLLSKEDRDNVILMHNKLTENKESIKHILSNKSLKNTFRELVRLDTTWWHSLEWTQDGKVLWKHIKKYNPIVLSSPLNKTNSLEGKTAWVKKHLGDHVKLLVVDDKEKYAKKNHLLIDDRDHILSRFVEAGGAGILHTSAQETIDKLNNRIGDNIKNIIQYEQYPNLSPKYRDAETKFANYLNTHLDEAVIKYKQHFGNVLGGDNAKELSEDFLKNKVEYGESAHEPSSAFIKYLYNKELNDPVPEGHNNTIIFTGGGPGSGKTTALSHLSKLADIQKKANIIYDTTMSSYGSASQKIDLALNKGRDINIMFVYREIVDSFEFGVITRLLKTGRSIPYKAHIIGHLDAIKTVLKLYQKYKNNDKVKFSFIDKSRGFDNIKLVGHEDIEKIETKSEQEYQEILLNLINEKYKRHELTEEQYRSLKGNEKDEIGKSESRGIESFNDREEMRSIYGSLFESIEYRKIDAALDILKAAFDNNQLNEKDYLEILEKAKRAKKILSRRKDTGKVYLQTHYIGNDEDFEIVINPSNDKNKDATEYKIKHKSGAYLNFGETNEGAIFFEYVEVPEEYKNQDIATQLITRLFDYADKKKAYLDMTGFLDEGKKYLTNVIAQLQKQYTNIEYSEIIEEKSELADYFKWKRKNVTYRGVREETDKPNSTASGILGRGLYTTPNSNKSMSKEYGDLYFVINGRPKNPKIFDSINKWEIWFQQNLLSKYNFDLKDFNKNTTIENELLSLGYDGAEISGREIVNYKPENVKYFKTENEVKNYFESLKVKTKAIEEQKAKPGKLFNNYIELILKIASGKQKEWFEWQNNNAKEIKITPIEEVFKIHPEIKSYIDAMKSSFKIKECYRTSTLVAHDVPAVKYVEGFVFFHGIPIEHAWNKIGDIYFDVTSDIVLKKHTDKSFGEEYDSVVELDSSTVMEHSFKTELYGELMREEFIKHLNSKDKDIKKSELINSELEVLQAQKENIKKSIESLESTFSFVKEVYESA